MTSLDSKQAPLNGNEIEGLPEDRLCAQLLQINRKTRLVWRFEDLSLFSSRALLSFEPQHSVKTPIERKQYVYLPAARSKLSFLQYVCLLNNELSEEALAPENRLHSFLIQDNNVCCTTGIKMSLIYADSRNLNSKRHIFILIQWYRYY